MPLQLQFVAVSNPTGPVPSKSRKLCHSHAARQAHARERRLRAQRYQKEVMQFRLDENMADLNTLRPLGRTPNRRNDPFAAIAIPLSSQEYFLLDYCTSPDALMLPLEFSPGLWHNLLELHHLPTCPFL